MNASLPAVRLAHTRLRVGLGRLGRSEGCWVANRLSITSVGVRWIGGWLWTAATVAIFFLLAFSPFVRRATLIAPSGLTIGMPLQSIAPTRISPSAGPIPARQSRDRALKLEVRNCVQVALPSNSEE